MNIRAFGRLLFTGFALPHGEFRASRFLPSKLKKDLNRPAPGARSPFSKRTKALIPITGLAGLVLALLMNAGVTPLPANANNCQVGSSSACPATSPQEIANLYGTTTNGVYWLRVNGIATRVYIVMDTSAAWGGGHWILLMQGQRGSTNFQYNSPYFTNNTEVLNVSSLTTDFSSDAVYAAFNHVPLDSIQAVFAQPVNGSISATGDVPSNKFGGHTWQESAGNRTAQARLGATQNLNNNSGNTSWTNVPNIKYRTGSGSGDSLVFSHQNGTGLYGFNLVNNGACANARWGIIWNNEGDFGSCDVYVGIGLSSNTTIGDHVNWFGTGTFPSVSNVSGGGKGSTAFQIWGKMAAPSLTAPNQPLVANTGLDQVAVSWNAVTGANEYVVQYRLYSSDTSASSWAPNLTQSVVVPGNSTTITGLSTATSYQFRVIARTNTNSSVPSTAREHTITPRTISFNSNGGTGTMATMDVADSVSTTLPANTFTREGHTFRGWNTAANGTGTNHANGANLSAIGANVTLFAMWTSLEDRAWDKNNTNAGYAFLNNAGDPVMPTLSSQAWTLEAWVRPDTIPSGWTPLLGQQDDSNLATGRNNIWLDGGQIKLLSPSSPTAEHPTGVFLSASHWTHIAWVMTTTTSAEFYVNGSLAWSGSMTRSNSGPFFTVGGTRQGGAGAPSFDGQIDQVKVWGAALTSTQVANSMHTHGSSFSGAPSASCITGLRAHYDFNEFVTGTVIDRSGCGKNLAFNTAASGGSFAESDFKSTGIVETSTAFSSLQNVVKFNRSYLTAAGGWTPPSGFARAKLLVVGGGGGAGVRHAGGGGAGGFIETEVSLAQQAQTVTVGMGGRGGPYMATSTSPATPATTRGQNSIAFSQIAVGGGAGAGRGTVTDGSLYSGGSGGGTDAPAENNTPGSGQPGQGNSGGQGSNSPFWTGGGGGGAGAVGAAAASGQGGKGGDGRASSITGTRTFYAGGGGGASGNTGIAGGSGGSGGGGAGGTFGTSSGTGGANGTAGTGGGGGGGGHADNVWGYAGGAGGSGVVILSYGASMDVTQTPGGARAGSTFQRPITVQLKNANGTNYTGANQQVTLTAASGSILQQTIGGVTTNITSTTTTSRDGVATFSSIGFQSGVGSSAQTLTVTADAFVGTSLSVTPTFVAATVNINATGPTTGSFIDGVFQSSTGTTATILNSDLVSAMTQRSILVESTGDINVVNGFTSSTAGSDITLKAGGSVTISASQRVQTNGGDVIIWSDSDVTGGGVIRLLNSSEICTVPGTAGPSGTCSTTTTGGGDIVLAGGAASVTDATRPGGYAAGFGTTSNSTGTSTMTGVQIGTQQQAGQGARLYSAGGQISIRGAGATANSNDRPTGIDVLANSVINSGAGQIQIDAEYRSSNAGQRTIEFSAWGGGGTTTIASTNTSPSAVVIRSSTAAGAASGNLGISANTTVFNVTGGLVFEAERINTGLNFTFNVSGQLVFRPFTTILLNESATTSFELPSSVAFTSNPSSITIGSSTNTSPIIVSENLQTTSGNIELLTSGAISKTTTTLTAAGEVTINSRSGSVSTGSGAISATSVRIEAGTTVALQGNITAGTSGTLVRSAGRIMGSAGASAANPLLLSSRGGPITLWTTGSSGGVTFGNFTQLNTTQAGASGADITIGGGPSNTADTSRPSGAAESTSDNGVSIGNLHSASLFVVRAGIGTFSMQASYTGVSSGAFSGIELYCGYDILAGKVLIEGQSSSTNNTTAQAGINSYSAQTVKSFIQATSHGANSNTLEILGSSGTAFGALLGGATTATDYLVLTASGDNAGIKVTGLTSKADAVGLFVGATTFETTNGLTTLNSGDKEIGLGRSGRLFTYRPIVGKPGGDVLIEAAGRDSLSSVVATSISTAGKVSFTSTGTSYSGALTFPASGSTTSVGGLEVSASNGQTVTASATVSSSGDVTYRAGTFENTASITSNNGNVLLQADNLNLSTSVNIAAPNGTVTLTPQSISRVIDLGSNVVGRMSLTDSELDRISAATLRIGALSGTNTGNIEVSAAISPALTPTLALRTGGSGTVSSTGTNSITETNLGVQAGGTISLAANNVISGNLALNSPAATLTYNQTTGSFTPATVDGISPEYGVPSSLTLSSVPTTATENRTLGEDFNPSPVATLRDEFSNLLIAANSQASRYSITVTRATGSGTVSGTLVRSTTAGVATFDNLRIIGTGGNHTLTFTASAVSAPAQMVGTPSATTGTYNIRSTQTITFTQMANRTMGGTNTFTVTATSDRGLTVAFTSDTSAVCTVSGTTVTMVTAGTCRINANQAGDSSVSPATQVQNEFQISPALVLTTPSAGLSGTFNSAYSLTLVRSGGASPYTFVVSSGTLPTGLSIESTTGVIRGTPSAPSTQTVTVRVTDANGATSTTSSFVLTINKAALANASAPTVVATTTALKSLDVSWSAVPNASSYTIKLYDSSGIGTALATVSTSGTSRTLTTADYASFADLTLYTVSVQAIGGTNYQDSTESARTTVYTRGLPASISVDTSGAVDSTGSWINGTWYTATLGTSRVTPTSLQNQLSSANATLQSSGSITVSSAVTSPNASRTVTLNSTGNNVTINGAISGLSSLQVTCDSGSFSSNSSGTIATGANASIQCSSVSTGAAITSGGSTSLTATGSSTDLSVGATITSTGVGEGITLKSKRSILSSASVNLRANGGPITIWSDSDAASGGGIRLGASNSICSGWSSSTCSSSGGDVVLGGGSAMTADANRPSGPAKGFGSTDDGNGITLGPCQVNYSTADGTSIRSNGGFISLNGEGSDSTATTSYITAGLALCNGASINSGSGKQFLKGVAKAASNFTDGVFAAPWSPGGSVSLLSSNSSDDAATIYAVGPRDGYVSFGLLYQNTSAGGLVVQADSFMTNYSKLEFRSAGAFVIQPAGDSFSKDLNLVADIVVSSSAKRLEVGSTTNTAALIVPASAAKTISGDMVFRSSSFSTSSALTSTAANGQILVVSDAVDISANLATTSTSGVVTIAPRTNTRPFDLGSETTGRVSLTSAEINRVSAGTLRIGALIGSNSGNIFVTAAIAPTSVSTLALRTSGSVESSGSGSITEVNLAISASYINLQGNNSITGNLALNSSGATLNYNQISGSFTPATVDQVTPEYGIATQITMSQVPAGSPIDQMMAVAFNPPPLATLRDKFGNELTTANSQSSSYTVTATKASGPGTLTGTKSTTTSTRGVARFTNLSISDTSGVHRVTFTATVTATSTQISGTPSATTGDYNIKVDQTISFTSTAPSSARASGATYTAQATASSGLSVTISVDASASSVCSISSGEVSFLAAGTCVLNANQAGNSTFTAAQQVQQSFAVASAKLDTPQAPTVTATANTLKSLNVSWSAVTGASSYTVKVYESPGTGSESAIVVGITGTSTTIRANEFSGIADGTLYYVSVTAIASVSDRNSDESLKTTATTNSPAVAPTIAFQPNGVNRTVGQSATLSVGATKTDNGVLSYQWLKDGTNISGATSSSLTRNNLAESDAGSYSVVVTNSLNGTTSSTTSRSVSLTVAPALTITTPSAGLSGTVNSAYSLTITAAGGATPRTFSTTSTLPTGVTLGSGGVLSGTPTQSGTFPITITVTDINSATATTSSFNLVIAAAPGLVPTFATPVSSISGSTDRLSVQITNFDPSYTYSGTSSIGTVSVNSSGLVVFSGITSGQTVTATITTNRTHYQNASASVTATLTPIPIISYNSSDLNSFDTSTTVRDLSGRGNHATRSATVPNSFDIDFASGAWKFPGGDNANGPYIDLPDLATNTFSNGITIDFEANFGSTKDYWERIIDFGKGVGSNLGPNNDNLWIGREANSDNLVVDVLRGGSAFRCSDVGVLAAPAFHRWTVILSQSGCTILRDGVVRGSNSSNMSVSPNQTWSSNFIGRSNWAADPQFEGQIRSIRIYAGTPTYSQIGAISYKTVSYNTNGGSAVSASTRGTTSGDLLLADAVTRTGYTFDGWYDSTNTLTRTKIGNAGARYTPTSSIQLAAGWDANTLNVTFNSNSGTLVTSTTTRTGEQLAEPTAPTRTGYTFAGWFPDSNLTGSALTFPYTHNQTSNFTLWAKWTPNPFTVTFVSNSGSAVTAFTTRTAEPLPDSFTTTRAGYTFNGWFVNSDLSGSQITFPYTHGRTADFTLYAKWTANSLTVTYNSNGGSAVTSTSTRTDEAISSAPTNPTRTGYTFGGWFENSDLSGSAVSFPYTHGKTANFTLFAKWDAVTLTVTYQSNGGTAVTSSTVRTDQQISAAPTEPTRTGYTFAGWRDNFGLTGNALTFPYTHGQTSNFILYAKWTPNVNTITFNANFPGGSTTTQSITSGVSTALTANSFTRAGYTFAGWSTADDGTGTSYTNQEVVGVTGSFTLYAKWTANTLNVTFNTNSGSAITTATTRTGQQFSTTATTTRAGYTFAGWFDNAGLTGSEVTFPYTHNQTANFTLFAKWTENTLNVTFNTNSGSAVTAVTTRTAESLPTTFTTTRAGYTFLGWFANADFSGSAISFPYVHGRTADFTLHAKWEANTLNVSFVTNSGTSVTATTTRTGEQLPTSFTTTRAGYNFLGWFDNAEFTGSAITFPYTHGKTANFSLYAKWDANTLTVTFDSKGGTSVTSTTTRTSESIASAPTAPTRAGYTFVDWFPTSDLSGAAVSFPYAHGKTTNFTLYAKWDANTLNVTFDSNSGSPVTSTTTRTAESISSGPAAPTRAGYTFAGWYDNPGFNGSQVVFPYAHGKTDNFTLYAKWTANDLTVSYATNGGSAVTSTQTRTAESISSAPSAPTRAGYNFLGWFETVDLTGSAITFPYTHGKTESFTLYAKWEAKTLNVTFNSSGGSAVSSTTTRTAESMLSAPTPPTRAGYNFLGWVENGDLSGTVVTFPYAHGKTGDFTLFAKWDANSLTVTFDVNGGDAVTATTTRTGEQIAATITATRAGYTFAGWYENSDLSGTVVRFPYAHGKTSNFTLYAKWTANELNVTFDTNSGTAVTATTTRTGDSISSAPVAPTRAGYTFAGWFNKAELTGSQVSFPYAHGKTANFTLYAKWTPNTLTVRFEINDGSGDVVTATTTTGSDVAAPANNPSYPGFEFMGWSATEGGSALTFPYLHGRTTDFTLYAVWKAGTYTVLFQYNGATGGNSVNSTSYTTDIIRTGIALPAPTRTAYTFSGWHSDIALTNPLTLKPNGRFVPTVNQTVYAKWTPIDYTVTYNYSNADSGSVPVDSRLYNTGQTVSLLGNSGLLGRTGYTFAGWVTSPSGLGTELNSGQTVSVVASNINFYPKWTPRTYSISYNLNGGSGSLTGAPVSWTVGTSNVTLPSSGFTRTGYDFGGWSRTPGGSAVSNSFSNNFVDESLTAVWTLKNIGYTFSPGAASSQGITRWPANASNTFGSEITLPDLTGEITNIGGSSYLFFGWGDGSATYRSGQKYVLGETAPQFTAQWVKLLDVRYSFGGGTKSSNDVENDNKDAECISGGLCTPNQEITLRDEPSRVGYTFAGWKAQATSETIIRAARTKTVIRDDNYLFFAEWTPIDYNFSFNSLGGSNNHANRTGNIGRILTMPDPGSRTGYTFGGWTPDGGVTKYAVGPTYVIGSSPVGFEATWIPDVYQISFDWQGGIGSPQPNTSYTVGRGPMTLPAQGDRVKDGYTFAGWSTTPGGEVVSNYEPTANGVLYAKWIDGNYTISFNAQNGPTPVTDVPVQRTSSTTLRTPTRANFRFIGWFDALTGGNFVGNAGVTYTPTASKTLYARWVQSSFFGIDEAALETATTYTASSTQGIDTTITHNPSGSQARIQIPAGTLPNGTVVSVRYFKDVTRQRSMIGENNNYFFSVVVSWLLGSGATATVPDTLFDSNNVQKPITVTLSNSQIKAGAMVYQVIDGVVTPMQRATVDGSITVRIYSDPELVVAATPPTAPQNVLVVGPGRGTSTVSWLAPASTGGSPITGYDVLLDGVQVCSAVTVMSCELTNLSDSNTYNVVVRAKNAVGNGQDATTTFTTLAPASSSSGSVPGPVLPVKPVDPPKPTDPVRPAPPRPAPVPSAPVPAPAPSDPAPAPIPPSAAPADPSAPTAPTAPSDPGASGSGSSDGGASIGATGNDNAPPVPFDPLASPEATAALTDTLGNAAAAVGAIAAAAGAAAAAAGAAAGAAGAAAGGGGGSGGSGGSRAPAGGSTGGSGEGGSIATIDTAHERYRNKRRGRGDRWKIWKKKWLTFADSPFIKMIVKTARFSPLISKITVDGAYLRAAFGSFGLLPTVASALIALGAVAVNDTGVAAPHWQWFIVLAVIGIFDAFAGLIGTTLFVVGTIVMHGSLGLDDVRLLLGVIIVGYGPALLANAFRAFRKEPEDGEEYWWERLVDLVVLPFIGGWVTATMISTLPALAGSTLAIANHVDTFGIAIAIAITLRVLLEEFVARWFPARLDTLHPTDVDDPAPIQKWISVAFRLSVFIFVTAALMGNVWQVWVGSALFILPTIIGFYSHRFKNFPWIWRILPTGIPGLAFALIVASLTTSVVGMWFGTSPDLALWSFALLPIPMLALSILGMLGREGNEGEIRWIRRPGFKWIYRIGGVVMLLATMQLAGVIQLI